MTIEELKTKKRELEKEIETLVHEFQLQTEVNIKSIDFNIIRPANSNVKIAFVTTDIDI